MKKWISLLLCLMLAAGFVICVNAAPARIVDEADLLDAYELEALTEKADDLADTYDMDVVIVTVDSLDGKSAMAYADDYYDENGYGIGSEDSGILFLLAMEEREWWISTCGEAIDVFTDYGIDQIGEDVTWYLSDGRYFDGFDAYLNALPEYFDAYEDGSPIDTGSGSQRGMFGIVFTSLLIGAGVALVVILIMRASMNTRRAKHSAGDYLKTGSYHLRQHHDMFLYSRVSKTRRQESSSGGSSTHRSSGGRSHGGGGGRF